MGYLLVGLNNMNHIDNIVQNYFSLNRTAGLTEFMYIVSYFFDVTLYSMGLFFCVALLIHLFRGKKYSIFFVSTILISSFLVYLLKMFFNIPRPLDGVVSAFGQSFPSYHATISTVFFIILMYVFDGYFKPFYRFIFNSFCFAVIFTVSFSRIYLGVHWLSDVLFGIVFGSFICYLSVLFFKKFKLL